MMPVVPGVLYPKEEDAFSIRLTIYQIGFISGVLLASRCGQTAKSMADYLWEELQTAIVDRQFPKPQKEKP